MVADDQNTECTVSRSGLQRARIGTFPMIWVFHLPGVEATHVMHQLVSEVRGKLGRSVVGQHEKGHGGCVFLGGGANGPAEGFDGGRSIGEGADEGGFVPGFSIVYFSGTEEGVFLVRPAEGGEREGSPEGVGTAFVGDA